MSECPHRRTRKVGRTREGVPVVDAECIECGETATPDLLGRTTDRGHGVATDGGEDHCGADGPAGLRCTRINGHDGSHKTYRKVGGDDHHIEWWECNPVGDPVEGGEEIATDGGEDIPTTPPEVEPEYVGAASVLVGETCLATVGETRSSLRPCGNDATHTVVYADAFGTKPVARCDECGHPEDAPDDREWSGELSKGDAGGREPIPDGGTRRCSTIVGDPQNPAETASPDDSPEARTVPCPTCGVDEGEPCEYFGGEGAGEPRGSPHSKRRTNARDARGDRA